MLKPLLIVLLLVCFVALWLNRHLFNTTPTPITTPTINTPSISTPIIIKPQPIEEMPLNEEENQTNSNELLHQEIQALFEQAILLFQKSLDDEAIELYDLIIAKIGKSDDITLLKDFVKACFQKALVYQIYPNIDKDSAIEAYEMVINRFEKSDNEILLKLYIQAKIKQAYLFDDDERMELYDELINKFANYKDNKFQSEVEELLFTQSFALMGKDDEEALRILESIISKYENNSEDYLPKNIQTSIINSIELSIITNNDDTKYRELADKYMSESPESKPLLGMLEILRNAQDLTQDDTLNTWKEEYPDYHFPDWSFQELRTWANKLEVPETKERILKYLDTFENYKYTTHTVQEGILYVPIRKNNIKSTNTETLY